MNIKTQNNTPSVRCLSGGAIGADTFFETIGAENTIETID